MSHMTTIGCHVSCFARIRGECIVLIRLVAFGILIITTIITSVYHLSHSHSRRRSSAFVA